MGNFIDKIVGFVSPSQGYAREAWRQELDQLRNYDAGDYRRLNSNWRAVNESAEYTDRASRDTVRARARDLERNSDIANSIIGAYKRNVVGAGYNLQAKTGDSELNNEIEALWKVWTKKINCDVTATQSFNQIMRMIEERKRVDGGILVYKAYTPGGILPFKLQCLEVDELDVTQTLPRKTTNKVVGGIEINPYNKAEGYWIRKYSVDGTYLNESEYVEAKNIIYVFSKKRPSQIREMSELAPTMTRIRDANEFMTAVSVKERIAACLSVFIKQSNPGSGLGRTGGASNNKYNYEGKTLTPGMIKYLNPGDEVETVNPAGQATDATNFIKLHQRMAGAGQGISYEATSRDMSESNYSSARQGMIEDDLTFMEDKELMIELADEIYGTFIISAVLAGKISPSMFWENKEKYMNHIWIQEPKRWIDPAKESTANKIALQTCQKTFKQISAESGKDWQEQIDDMAEVMEYAKQKGVQLGGIFENVTTANTATTKAK